MTYCIKGVKWIGGCIYVGSMKSPENLQQHTHSHGLAYRSTLETVRELENKI